MKAKERREMDRGIAEILQGRSLYEAYLEHERKHEEKREEIRRRKVRRDKDAD